MENPTYLGDAVYAFNNGTHIELRLNSHDSPTLIYLEEEVLSALFRFASVPKPQAAASPGLPAVETQSEAVSSALASKRAEIEADLAFFDRCAKILARLPDAVVSSAQPVCGSLVLYGCNRERVKAVLSVLNAGKWKKEVNSTRADALDYTAEIDGITVQMWAAAPPESCKIVEEEIEVPATKVIKRTLVCK